MYLKVYKCFLYKKVLRFNYVNPPYSRNVSSTLTDVNIRFVYNVTRHLTRKSRPDKYIDETSTQYGKSTEIVSEVNGIYSSMINFYSVRDLSK